MLCERSPQSSTCSSISDQNFLQVQRMVGIGDSHIDVFKKPFAPPPRKKKKKVLDEETYVHEVGKIIERDFFPDLENLQDKVEFLEARQNNDIERLQSLQRKYSTGGRLPTPASVIDSPPTFDTPEPDSRQKRKKVQAATEETEQQKQDQTISETASSVGDSVEKSTKELTLDEFLRRNTSEDDDSFEQIMEDTKQKYIHSKSWMFNKEELHNAEFAPDLTMKALPSSQFEAIEMARKEQAVPQRVENWKYKTFNAVMYVPEEHHTSRARQLHIASVPALAVVHSNTRFKENPFMRPLNQATVLEASNVQAIKKEGRIGVDGRELSKVTPRVRGYSFVGDASPCPGVEASPLMTWGEIEGTPFVLDKCSTPQVHSGAAPSYSIPKVPDRDMVALRLNEKANRAQRDKKSKALSAARSSLCSPLVVGSGPGAERWASERLSGMSPAARKLLSSGLGLRQNTDLSLRASYTPSPGSGRKKSTPSFRSQFSTYNTPADSFNINPKTTKSGKTPSSTGRTPNSNNVKSASSEHGNNLIPSVTAPKSSGSSSLTDGLLQLPKRDGVQLHRIKKGKTAVESKEKFVSDRACAADFF